MTKLAIPSPVITTIPVHGSEEVFPVRRVYCIGRNYADHVIEIPETEEALTPLLTTIPFQLLSYHIAVMLDKNVDQPRNLAKSVTVE